MDWFDYNDYIIFSCFLPASCEWQQSAVGYGWWHWLAVLWDKMGWDESYAWDKKCQTQNLNHFTDQIFRFLHEHRGMLFIHHFIYESKQCSVSFNSFTTVLQMKSRILVIFVLARSNPFSFINSLEPLEVPLPLRNHNVFYPLFKKAKTIKALLFEEIREEHVTNSVASVRHHAGQLCSHISCKIQEPTWWSGPCEHTPRSDSPRLPRNPGSLRRSSC